MPSWSKFGGSSKKPPEPSDFNAKNFADLHNFCHTTLISLIRDINRRVKKLEPTHEQYQLEALQASAASGNASSIEGLQTFMDKLKPEEMNIGSEGGGRRRRSKSRSKRRRSKSRSKSRSKRHRSKRRRSKSRSRKRRSRRHRRHR